MLVRQAGGGLGNRLFLDPMRVAARGGGASNIQSIKSKTKKSNERWSDFFFSSSLLLFSLSLLPPFLIFFFSSSLFLLSLSLSFPSFFLLLRGVL